VFQLLVVPLPALSFRHGCVGFHAVDLICLGVLGVKTRAGLHLLAGGLHVVVLLALNPDTSLAARRTRGLLELLFIFVEDVLLILRILLHKEHILLLVVHLLLWRLG
jgi:hypothetical protein